MDTALTSRKFGPTALWRINYCRMYLNVLLVSDVTTPDGKCIDMAAYEGNKQALQSYDTGDSVNQSIPNDKAWAEWRQCLNLLCQSTHTHTLKEPLGAWIVQPHEYSRDWALLYSAAEDAIYSSNDIDYSVHRCLRHDYGKDTDEYVDTLPKDAVPIDAKETPHTWIQPRSIVPQDCVSETDDIETVTSLVGTLPPWERYLLLNIMFRENEEDVWRKLCSQQCWAASDGSAPQDRGSFAWVLSDDKGERLARCTGPVFGHSISSYRAEAYGLLSFFCFLLHMVRLHQKQDDRCHPPHLVCDNLGLIKSVTKLRDYPTIYPNTTLEAEWDCLAQILVTSRELGAKTPTIDHIKGHQDERAPYKELPLLAQLNCDADSFANTFLQTHMDLDHTRVHQFPAGECVLQLKKGTITQDLKHECSQAQNLPAYQSYVTRKNKWSDDTVFTTVDWTAHGQALKRHDQHRPTFVKLVHKRLPVGAHVNKYDPKYPPNCLTCNHEKETMDHFWKCQAPSRLAWQRQFLQELNQKLIELRIGPEARNLLVNKMRAVLDGDNPDLIPNPPELADICAQQQAIKWEQILLGRFARAWNTHPRIQPGSQQHSNKTWTTEIIDFIFMQWWTLWESRNKDRHGRDLATQQQATAQQVDRELQMFYDNYKECAPQHLRWIFDTTINVQRQWPVYTTRQWLNTWNPIFSETVNPAAAPTNPENYPYTTSLETG